MAQCVPRTKAYGVNVAEIDGQHEELSRRPNPLMDVETRTRKTMIKEVTQVMVADHGSNLHHNA